MVRHLQLSCDEADHWLHSGDQLTQPEFHRFYSTMPNGFKAELVGGVVFEPSRLGLDHSDMQVHLNSAFLAYAGPTRGLQVGDNASVILSGQDEVQPDLFLRILPEYGGQSSDITIRKKKAKDVGARYIQGAPELLAEIAHSSRAIDLHLKKQRYAAAGVIEYLVICLKPQQIFWFDLNDQTELIPETDGIFRSALFPGLWINKDALFRCQYKQLVETIALGMRTAEYEELSDRLAKSFRSMIL